VTRPDLVVECFETMSEQRLELIAVYMCVAVIVICQSRELLLVLVTR